MVVERHSQMVSNEILSRGTHVHRVPELKLMTHFTKEFFSNIRASSGIVILSKENVIPSGLSHSFSLDSKRTSFLSIHVFRSLEEVRNSVISHINSRVRKRLNNKLLIPRELGSETNSTRASPLLKPVENMFKLFLSLIVVAFKAVGLNMVHNLVFPVLFSIGHHPLITESTDAAVTSSGDNFRLRLIVRNGLSFSDHLFLDDELGIFNLLSVALTFNSHNTIIESLLVAFIFSFFKLILILRSSNLSRLNGLLSTHVSHARNFNNGNRLERLNPLGLNFVVIRLLLEVS